MAIVKFIPAVYDIRNPKIIPWNFVKLVEAADIARRNPEDFLLHFLPLSRINEAIKVAIEGTPSIFTISTCYHKGRTHLVISREAALELSKIEIRSFSLVGDLFTVSSELLMKIFVPFGWWKLIQRVLELSPTGLYALEEQLPNEERSSFIILGRLFPKNSAILAIFPLDKNGHKIPK